MIEIYYHAVECVCLMFFGLMTGFILFMSFCQIMDEMDENDIHIYELPDCDSDEDDEFKQQDIELKVL